MLKSKPVDIDKNKLLNDLKGRLVGIDALNDEPDFFQKDETLLRYLKAREWNLKEAEKQLLGTIEWRRKTNPHCIDCKYCHDKPGFHSMRQIGFDVSGRPIIYSSFSQSNCTKNTVEESIMHVTYLIENAKRAMAPGITTFVLVIDCSGVTIQACNPKLGYEVTNILSSHYPERLGQVFCVNHSPLFQGIWNAIKVFLHPNTANKVKLVKKSNIMEKFQKIFCPETTEWLLEEMSLNKMKNIPDSQKTFWLKTDDNHDPRGCPSYVKTYCNRTDWDNDSTCPASEKPHQVHPNIIDALKGQLSQEESIRIVHNSSSNVLNGSNTASNTDEVDMDEWEDLDDDNLNIPVELQITDSAQKIN